MTYTVANGYPLRLKAEVGRPTGKTYSPLTFKLNVLEVITAVRVILTTTSKGFSWNDSLMRLTWNAMERHGNQLSDT